MKSRDQILSGSEESPWAEIEIPEWGGKFLLRPLRGDQAEEVELLNIQARQSGELLCLRGLAGRVAAWTVSTLERKPVFQVSDGDSLTRQYHAICATVYLEVLKANGLMKTVASVVEDAGKNSESIQSSGSGCTSPEPSPEAPSKSASSE
jgi:hypothetical protein